MVLYRSRTPIRRLFWVPAFAAFSSSLLTAPLWARSATTLVAGTSLRAELIKGARVRRHQVVTAKLLDPVFVTDDLILPAGTLIHGEIAALAPDRKRRFKARLNGDFTPFHQPQVHFLSLTLPSGDNLPIQTTEGVGAVVVRLAAAQSKHHSGSYIRQGWELAKTEAQSAIGVFTAPGKAERLERFAYTQLPYHPEKLYRGVAYGFDLEQPADIPNQRAFMAAETTSSSGGPPLRAYLRTSISSYSTTVGTPIEAIVAEPYTDSEKGLKIPQGAALLGNVTQAKPARWFSRGGKLRFAFKEVRLPEGTKQEVQGVPSAVEAETQQEIAMDSEGGVKPAPKSRFLLPLLTVYLASFASEGDAGNSVAGDAASSNSFGLVGRMVGIAAGSPKIAMALGYYAAATTSYDSFIARGRDVVFPRNTRLEIELHLARDNRLPPGQSVNRQKP